MRFIYIVHVVAASLALVSGYVALYAVKGVSLHRKSGTLFVYTMLTMSVAGAMIAGIRDITPAVNIPAALITSYMVITSLTTLKPLSSHPRAFDIGLMAVIIAVSVFEIKFGIEAIANGGMRQGIPAFPFFMFGIVGLLAAAGDFRMIRNGALKGASRIARHLWRMSYALLIAALSFFIGQAKVIPKPIRIYPLLALPVLAVLVTMLYWLWRVRIRRSLQGLVTSSREPARPRAIPLHREIG
ncbi:MAG TPA: hypothetical protein VM939_04605 [Gemmatimonadaceae bacterium]|nr:hypothetical protein [Gemmatimonadaceae bacterium]